MNAFVVAANSSMMPLGSVKFFDALRNQTHQLISQEFRLGGGADRLDYVVGVYHLDQNCDITNAQGASIDGVATPRQIASQDNTAYAVFGQIDHKLVEDLTLTVGGRYSYEEKTFANQPRFFPSSRTYEDNWADFAPKIDLTCQASENVINNTFGLGALGDLRIYQPPRTWAVDLGETCRFASATGTRTALIIIVTPFWWAVLRYFLAARNTRKELGLVAR